MKVLGKSLDKGLCKRYLGYASACEAYRIHYNFNCYKAFRLYNLGKFLFSNVMHRPLSRLLSMTSILQNK